MALSTEVVYEGYENSISLRLQVDGVAIADHRSITRVVLEFGRGGNVLSPDPYLTLDSSVNPEYFDLTEVEKLILNLGGASVPRGRHNVYLTIFIAAYPGGLSYGPALDIRVK